MSDTRELDRRDWRERLRAAIDSSGMKHSLVALDAGITPETLSRILTAEHQRPSLDTITRIAHAVNENVGWILGEGGFELSADQWQQLSQVVRFLATNLFNAPLPHTIVESTSNVIRLPRRRAIPREFRALGGRMTCQVTDDSLRDAGVLDGDLLFVKPASDPRECVGSLILCNVDGEPYSKKLERRMNRFRLLSGNEKYAPLEVDDDELELIGVVIGRSGGLA